ncbi:MAG: GNAT family N-acetyltransferase [Angelakisella sp.]
MITTASQEHLTGIRALWQQAFGDNVEYINMFLNQCAKFENTLVYLKENTVCGMLFILPCNLVFQKSGHQCAYFYGVATRQEEQGRGISTELLQYAYDLCKSRGYAVCALVPASSSLFQFYAKRGYTTQGYIKTLSVDAGELTDVRSSAVFSKIDHNDVFDIRKKFFDTAYLEWDSWTLAYIQAENKYLGGSFYHYDVQGECGYLSCLPHDDTVVIKEFAGKDARLFDLLKGLHGIYNKQTYQVRLSNTAAMGELTPFAMTKWIGKGPETPFYLSHVFD